MFLACSHRCWRSTSNAAPTLGVSHQSIEQGLVEALEAALALGERARAEELLAAVDAVPAGMRPPLLVSQSLRVRARLGDGADGFAAAARRFRELGLPFWLAVTLLEHAELLGEQGSTDETRTASR